MKRSLAIAAFALASSSACRDVAEFDTRGRDHYQGAVIAGSFVRSGLADGTRMCLTLDTERLQDTPGTLTTNDGRFRATPLRPIPQVWHDPLATFSFGDGRRRNLIYVATPQEDGGVGSDVVAIVSLMQAGTIEARLFRGAPGDVTSTTPPLFGVFTLTRHEGNCEL